MSGTPPKAACYPLADGEAAALRAQGAWAVLADDPSRGADWPAGALRGRGTLPGAPRLAIVGARRADPYGCEIAGRIAAAAAARGVAIVSGGAFGIDIAAHRGALAAGGRTVVVLGAALDRAGPVSHRADFDRVVASGAMVSPFPLGQAPAHWTYPRRNPWIASLSQGTVVVQAALRSGSLQTARSALAMGRPVWVVPGPMDSPLHAGCHALIAEGAQILMHPAGWAEALGVEAQVAPAAEARGPSEGHALWAVASAEAQPLVQLAEQAGLTVAEASLQATMLELDGWLRAAPGGRYARSQPGTRGRT